MIGYNLLIRKNFESDALVLLDGVPVFDIDKLFLFEPLKVKTIDVVARKYFRGSGVFEGIVNMSTYSHDLNGYETDIRATVIKNQSVQKEDLSIVLYMMILTPKEIEYLILGGCCTGRLHYMWIH